jgi:dipeptidyl aminopeptidase/acylaminoacyl peptidase
MTITRTKPTMATLYAERPGARRFTAEDLWRIPRVGDPAASPDGSLIAIPVTTYDLAANEGRVRIWLSSVASADIRPMTAPDCSSTTPAFAPDGKQLAFTRKTARGKAQLFVMPIDGGEPRRLTDLPLGAFDPKWLPDGRGIVFAAPLLKGHLTPEATAAELERREKNPMKAHITEERFYRYWDTWLTTGEVPHLFVIDVATETLRDLTPASTLWLDWMEPCGQYDIAPDAAEIAFAGIAFDQDRSVIQSAVFAVPLAGGEVRRVTHDQGDCLRPRYTFDGRSLVYGLQRDPRFYADPIRLIRYDRATQTHEPLLDAWRLSPTFWIAGRDGRLFLEAEREGRTDLFVLDTGSAEPRSLTSRGSVHGTAMAGNGTLVFTRQTLSEPAEVWSVDPDGQSLRQLTSFTSAVTREIAFGEVREMTFDGAYGEPVQMYDILPPGYTKGAAYPLVHVIHGGPHGISADQFHSRWNAQLFAAPGYVAALVNFQGSTSWGDAFTRSILGAWGDRPFQDVMRATDTLITSGLVDENRMAATGASYGGYLAAWIEGHTDRFRCIVNHAGVYNTLSQYASDVTQGRHVSFGGEPWDGLEVIERWNPARFASGFTTPMLVIHGERDYRVPAAQGLECYGVLKAKGIPARLVYFPDENHWVLKPANSILWYQEVHNWLARFLV